MQRNTFDEVHSPLVVLTSKGVPISVVGTAQVSLQAAKVQAKITEEEMQVKILELEIMRREKEMDSKVKKPAEDEECKKAQNIDIEEQKVVLEAKANQMGKKAAKAEAELVYTLQAVKVKEKQKVRLESEAK